MKFAISSREPASLPATPLAHYQTVAYAALLRAYGSTPWWATVEANGRILASWLLFQPRPVTFAEWLLRKTTLRAMHGPVLAANLAEPNRRLVREAVFQEVADWSARRGFRKLDLRLDPVMSPDERRENAAAVTKAGFSIRPIHTYIAHLGANAEDIRAQIAPDRRTKVRKAEKLAPEFIVGSTAEIIALYGAIRRQTAARNGVAPPPTGHVEDTESALRGSGIFQILLARFGERVGAGQVVFLHDTFAALSGVSIADWAIAENVPANDFLQCRMLEWACQKGVRLADFGGAQPDSTDPKIQAIDAFKARWGTVLEESLALHRDSSSSLSQSAAREAVI